MLWKSCGYPITGIQSQNVQIGHPCDCMPIPWQIGTQRTNHDRKFCYRYDYNDNNYAATAQKIFSYQHFIQFFKIR